MSLALWPLTIKALKGWGWRHIGACMDVCYYSALTLSVVWVYEFQMSWMGFKLIECRRNTFPAWGTYFIQRCVPEKEEDFELKCKSSPMLECVLALSAPTRVRQHTSTHIHTHNTYELLCYTLLYLQVRMQSEGKLPPGTPKRYPTAFKAYPTIVRWVRCRAVDGHQCCSADAVG